MTPRTLKKAEKRHAPVSDDESSPLGPRMKKIRVIPSDQPIMVTRKGLEDLCAIASQVSQLSEAFAEAAETFQDLLEEYLDGVAASPAAGRNTTNDTAETV